MNAHGQRAALAETVREACIEAALAGYEEAAIAGLCGEGALEAAVSAIRRLDIEAVIATRPRESRSRQPEP